jgi:hypothetical protein
MMVSFLQVVTTFFTLYLVFPVATPTRVVYMGCNPSSVATQINNPGCGCNPGCNPNLIKNNFPIILIIFFELFDIFKNY